MFPVFDRGPTGGPLAEEFPEATVEDRRCGPARALRLFSSAAFVAAHGLPGGRRAMCRTAVAPAADGEGPGAGEDPHEADSAGTGPWGHRRRPRRSMSAR
jgi:hypothetical protein